MTINNIFKLFSHRLTQIFTDFIRVLSVKSVANLKCKIFTDTCLIDFLHEIPAAEQFLETLRNNGEAPAISAITRMELVEGCRNKRELAGVIKFLGEFKLIHISEQISQKAIELIESYKLSHGLLIPDAIIAATAIIMNSELYSKNARHFEMIRELKVTRPY